MTTLCLAVLLALVPGPARADVAPEPAPSGGCKCATGPEAAPPHVVSSGSLLLGLALAGAAARRRR